MRHLVKKIKFKKGRDANKILLIKLSANFLESGLIKTTKSKAKVLISFLEKILNQLRKKKTEKEQINILEKKFGKKRKLINLIIKELLPQIKEKKSGLFRLINLGYRNGDGSLIVKVEWSLPVVLKTKKDKQSEIKIKSKEAINKNKLENLKKK